MIKFGLRDDPTSDTVMINADIRNVGFRPIL
ncbi:hypothetical protein NPIL_257511, partial [Nephila pilipes]